MDIGNYSEMTLNLNDQFTQPPAQNCSKQTHTRACERTYTHTLALGGSVVW